MKKSGWMLLLWLAAAYNLVIAAVGFVAPDRTSDQLVISLFVGCFGIAYAVIASEPYRYRPVLWSGVAGKLGVIALLGPASVAEGADPMLAPILVGDALFALGFLWFLLHRPSADGFQRLG